MSTTIEVHENSFSIKGFQYYRKHKKVFTNRSFATLLSKTKCIGIRSISVAAGLILDKLVWIERGGVRLDANPETELKKGDEIVLWMGLGNMHYKFRKGKLILIG